MSTGLTCEVCMKNEAVGVASIPGVPISVAYCRECLAANAHPLHIVVANTACIGGLGEAANWWRQLVEDTLKHLGVTMEEFNRLVDESIKCIDMPSSYE